MHGWNGNSRTRWRHGCSTDRVNAPRTCNVRLLYAYALEVAKSDGITCQTTFKVSVVVLGLIPREPTWRIRTSGGMKRRWKADKGRGDGWKEVEGGSEGQWGGVVVKGKWGVRTKCGEGHTIGRSVGWDARSCPSCMLFESAHGSEEKQKKKGCVEKKIRKEKWQGPQRPRQIESPTEFGERKEKKKNAMDFITPIRYQMAMQWQWQ